MSTNPECERTRALAAEVALGITSAEERARVLEHVASCAECKQLVGELGEIADGLLLLAPEAEPPSGFESTTLKHLRVGRSHRPSWRSAVASALVAVLAAGGVVLATRDDRRLAAEYGRVLHEADGTYFGVFSLRDPGGAEAGDLFVYNGARPWIFVAFEEVMPPGDYRAELLMHDGERIGLGSFELAVDDLEWGAGVDVDLREVHSARFVSQQSGTSYSVPLGEH
ncbi:MAG: hypothetical protein QOH26_1317 [Actinomycetota bacterium]|jgi:hypothetical protein|nr:hypothetical protein [Actinomycetota bacterium]